MTEPEDDHALWGIPDDAEYSEVALDLDGGGSLSYHCYTIGDERMLIEFEIQGGSFFVPFPIIQVHVDGEWITVEDDDSPPEIIKRF